MNPARRLRVKMCAAALLGMAGCGGGGGGGGDAPPTPGGQPDQGVLPPRSGAFGGGQGKILYVQGGDAPQVVSEFDLATRRSRDVITLARTRHHYLAGGVSRARDGSFLVTDKVGASLDDRGWLYHCAADGTVLSSFESPTRDPSGATISPDARYSAHGVTGRIPGSDKYETQIILMDLRAGTAMRGVILGGDEEPLNKSLNPPNEHTVWAPGGTLYMMTRYGLFRVEPSTAVATRLHRFQIPVANSPSISPDGAYIWFEGEGGSGGRPALWSLNIQTGEMLRRVERSRTGLQYAPTVSPDGQWLLMQQVTSVATGVGTRNTFFVSALRITAAAQDAESLELKVVDAAGEGFSANGRMAWD